MDGKTESKKIVKKILFITDDFESTICPEGQGHWECLKKLCEPGNIFFHPEDNWLGFAFSIIKSFDDAVLTDYDAVLIDYGLIGDSRWSMTILGRLHKKGVKLAWVGGLPERYNADAKIIFPTRKYLHNLPSSSIGHENILFLLYSLFEKEKLKICWEEFQKGD